MSFGTKYCGWRFRNIDPVKDNDEFSEQRVGVETTEKLFDLVTESDEESSSGDEELAFEVIATLLALGEKVVDNKSIGVTTEAVAFDDISTVCASEEVTEVDINAAAVANEEVLEIENNTTAVAEEEGLVDDESTESKD